MNAVGSVTCWVVLVALLAGAFFIACDMFWEWLRG